MYNSLEIAKVNKHFGDFRAVDDIDFFSVAEGDFFSPF